MDLCWQSNVSAFLICCLGCLSEKAMATHSSTFAWKIPWMEEPGRLQSMRSLESDMTEQLHFDFLLWCIGEGNGNPVQCSCLENPRDGEAWWAAVSGVTHSWTRLKRLSSSSSSRCPSTNEWIKKLWCIYTMEYYPAIKRNAFELVLMRWMNIETVIQSEVRKRKANITY